MQVIGLTNIKQFSCCKLHYIRKCFIQTYMALDNQPFLTYPIYMPFYFYVITAGILESSVQRGRLNQLRTWTWRSILLNTMKCRRRGTCYKIRDNTSMSLSKAISQSLMKQVITQKFCVTSKNKCWFLLVPNKK